MKTWPRRLGQLSAVRIPEPILDGEIFGNIAHLETDELKPLLQLADEEYARIKNLGKEYHSLVVNPSVIVINDTGLDEVMVRLNSQNGPNGSWLPTVVESKGKLYRVWGKTSYCG